MSETDGGCGGDMFLIAGRHSEKFSEVALGSKHMAVCIFSLTTHYSTFTDFCDMTYVSK